MGAAVSITLAAIEPLPLDAKSTQRIARDQVIACIDRFLVNYSGAATIGHAGRVTLRYLKEMGKGGGVRSVVTILGGRSSRISGGAATQWEALWGWFLVVPGTIKDRTTDAADLTGEAIRFVEFSPWSKIAAGIAQGVARFTGTPGSVVPLAQSLARNSGLLYSTTVGGVIDGSGVLDLQIAADGVGEDYNAPDSVILNLAAPPVGVNASARVPLGLTGGISETAFAKTPRAGSVQLVPLHKDDDESLGSSIWLVRWDQEIGLGTAERPGLVPPDVLERIYGFSTIPSTPNDQEFTQAVGDA